MNYQPPANGILLQHDLGSSKIYKIACECGDPTHDLTLDVEADGSVISVTHYVKVQTDWWATPTPFYWLNGIVNRINLTWKVWIKGYLQYETSTYMTKQQAFNYAHTLNEAIKDVERFQENCKQSR